MTTWKLEARRPNIVPDPKGTRRIKMHGVEVRPIRLHGCVAEEHDSAINIRPSTLFEDSVRASVSKVDDYANEIAADYYRRAFWAGLFVGAGSVALLGAVLWLLGVR